MSDTPTPRAVLIHKAWMRQHDALQAFIGHPGVLWEPVKQAQQDIEAAIRADERAALAASAGPLSVERLAEIRNWTEVCEGDSGVPVTSTALRDLLTAYTALAAECAALRATVAEWNDCRPVLRGFAVTMEEVLKENDHKGGWSRCAPSWLLRRLQAEVNELVREVQKKERDGQRIAEEAADVANFAMMIADRLARTPTPEGQG